MSHAAIVRKLWVTVGIARIAAARRRRKLPRLLRRYGVANNVCSQSSLPDLAARHASRCTAQPWRSEWEHAWPALAHCRRCWHTC